MATAILTQARLKEALHYSIITGKFHWLKRPSAKGVTITTGVAGSMHCRGYVALTLDGKSYLAHRLAWLYVMGAWPANQIDHKDARRANNAWLNLREATNSQNMQNLSGPPKHNTSGLLGVSLIKSSGKWKSQIKINKKVTNLGHFNTPEEAHAAYVAAKRKLHPFGNL